MRKKYWLGEVRECDICKKELGDKKYAGIVFVDGRTKNGTWANMCISCYKENGVGIGIGMGQVYELQRSGKDIGRWLKIA